VRQSSAPASELTNGWEFAPIIDPDVFDKAQAKLAATKTRAYRAPKTAHVRQKAEVLKTVVDKIVCHFRRVGTRATLEFIEVTPAEDAAAGPLTFPGSLLTDSCLGDLA